MSIADWGVLGFLLVLAALLGWLEIRYMMRRDQEPEEESRWPEWWDRGSPEEIGGLGADVAERIAAAIQRLPSWSAGIPGLAPEPAGATARMAL